MKRNILILFLVLVNVSLAQTRLEVKMSKTTLKVGESAQLSFIFNAVGDDFIPPKITGFQVNGPMVSQSENIINGAYSGNQQFAYVIQAIRPGKFTIPSAMVEFKGRIFKSQPVIVTVLNQNIKGEKQTNEDSYVSKNNVGKNAPVFIEAEISKTNVYINEPVEVSYRVYLNPKFKIEKENKINFPKYNNFWSQTEDLRDNHWEQVVVNGRIYYTKLFRRTVLYPQKTGNLSIDPLSLDFNIAYPTGELDFFNDPQYETARRVIATPSKTIVVKPLPEKGKPENFTGAVGVFEFNVIVDKLESKTGEAIQMEFVVTGTGNLKLFELPKPNLPADFEIFEPTHKEDIEENIRGMSGSISDSYTIIPQNKGKFLVKPQQFSYFDIQSKSYKTISSDEINLTVAQGDKHISQLQKNKMASPKTILPIFTEATFFTLNSSTFFNSVWFYLLLGLPILTALFLLVDKRKINEKEEKEHKIILNNKKPIAPVSWQNLEQKSTDKEVFYAEIEQELKAFITTYFHIDPTLSNETLREQLSEKGVELSLIVQIDKLLQTCEIAKYTPVSNLNKTQDLEQANEIINQLKGYL
ncbi:BatD family protein [Flavobacterium sp.]|uniref:BatD family protein n=1 Tax=Flavobacterium sp. TaxID=239 RepID=UPI0025C72EF3|nr:BatD family protein [Flavobacterium sp.]